MILAPEVHVANEIDAEDEQVADDEKPHARVAGDMTACASSRLRLVDAGGGAFSNVGHALVLAGVSGAARCGSGEALSSSASGWFLIAR